MEREHELRPAIVDLGVASVETHGAAGFFSDEVLKQDHAGLSDA